jgi:hypothetical protein
VLVSNQRPPACKFVDGLPRESASVRHGVVSRVLCPPQGIRAIAAKASLAWAPKGLTTLTNSQSLRYRRLSPLAFKTSPVPKVAPQSLDRRVRWLSNLAFKNRVRAHPGYPFTRNPTNLPKLTNSRVSLQIIKVFVAGKPLTRKRKLTNLTTVLTSAAAHSLRLG